ncbi:MAG TPA: iron-containing alcohol dehydrogenase [Bacillota bacterium]|jgi:alcohol dehydrogenase class IV|nr:iron-containing alcohol dehydrogenase [Bacillota bacterium]HOL09395.1 iron-containing alcohol dehydrogenase [Bacillota bacterium]HPO97119.1 iron-containing alcohol dehydrogenase [Bacillota bacterium]
MINKKPIASNNSIPNRFNLATEIIFGLDSIQQLPKEGAKLGQRVLVVSGRNWIIKSGVLTQILNILKEAQFEVSVFSEIEPEPSLQTVARGLEVARSNGVNWVLGIGGGSAMDAAKAIAGLYNQSLPVEKYFYGAEITQPGIPVLTVPTTSGSGAEVTVNSVLSDTEKGVKQSIRSVYLTPKITIVDPKLTLSNSPQLTAYSGFDALVQAIESFTSNGATPFTDIYAYEAIKNIGNNLLTVYQDGSNLEARTAMSLGSLMAGIALTNARLGAVHGLAHSIGIRTKQPHGLVCAVLLVPVMRYNIAVCDRKYALMAQAFGHNIDGMDSLDAAAQGIKTIMAIQKKLGIPTRLSSLGVKEEDFQSIAEEGLLSGSTKANPRPVSLEVFLKILRENY